MRRGVSVWTFVTAAEVVGAAILGGVVGGLGFCRLGRGDVKGEPGADIILQYDKGED